MSSSFKPLKEGSASFWHNRKKSEDYVKLRNLRSKFMLICFLGLKFYEFLLFYALFSIVVSSLDVHSYAYRSSANDFCSKSSEPLKGASH